jgi:hypothetical protein
MDVPLKGPRYTLEHTADGIRAIVPSRKNWFVIVFLSIWLCGWFAGESSALSQLLGHPLAGKMPGLDEAEAKMLVKEFSTRLKG